MSQENTQLTKVQGYNPKAQMIFSEPIAGSVPNSTPKIEFKRINISTKNADGSIGELILPTEKLFSFGVSENVSQESGKVTGYTFPLCMYTREDPKDEEKEWVDVFNQIVDNCIDHLVDNREEIELFELQRSDLTKAKGGLNPMYWRKETVKDEQSGKKVLRNVEGQGPTLYTKLIYSKKNQKFLTDFFNKSDEPLDASELMGKYCYANTAIKIESIFMSGTGKLSLQVKLYEAVIELMKTGKQRLLDRPRATSKVLSAKSSENTSSLLEDDNENDSDGSLVDDNEQEKEKVEVDPQPKKIVRRVKKVIK
jgi:hypothetical protein|uniref:Uncharacterized protein n=1 Tax=viral metagenome TaxID=1070528 RepID=A0A6C0J135_9ZZZZ